jgi:hypothetical protein
MNLKEEMVKSGIVDPVMLKELSIWGAPIEEVFDMDWDDAPHTLEEVLLRIRQAVEDRDRVEIRSTDLDIMRRYLEHQEEGKLHLEDPITDQKSNIKVFFARTGMGQIIIPWRSETIEDLLISPESYLKVGDTKLFFGAVEELFFGKQKTFLLCSVAEVEKKDE